MCGIIGYTGSSEDASTKIMIGLKALEYRGYDSAGLALQITPGYQRRLFIGKTVGGVDKLIESVPEMKSNCGIGHNRWATHGKITRQNAHPHYSDDYRVAIVHNGVIDNADFLRDCLIEEGFVFKSETDSEVIVHLLDKYFKKHRNAKVAINHAIEELSGTYGFVAVFSEIPSALFFSRKGSPLVVGLGNTETYIASDVNALPPDIIKVAYIEDGQSGVITRTSLSLFNSEAQFQPNIVDVKKEKRVTSKGDYEHFMLKEIHEQPDSIRRAFSGRIRQDNCILDGFNTTSLELATTTKVVILGCGTSYYAGLIAAEHIRKFARINAEVRLASEFSTGHFIPDVNAMYLAISQSGETYDTLEAVKELLNKGCSVYGIINTVGSTLARLCGKGAYIHAGPEISVASTKAFTSQLATLSMFAIMMGRATNMSADAGRYYCRQLELAAKRVEIFLSHQSRLKQVKVLAKEIANAPYLLFLGRGVNYPTAMEGALKMKEIAYIPCDAYAGGEMKHGPIAMIDEGTHVIAIVDYEGPLVTKMMSNIQEVKARGARVHVITNNIVNMTEGEMNINTTHVISQFTPFVNVVALQLLAYYVALEKGFDIDKPKNLAKSVTVG